MYDRMVIGIDQSYTRTGISIAADGELLKVSSEAFKGCQTKSEKRKRLGNIIRLILEKNQSKANQCAIICERIRIISRGELSMAYIKATAALIASIVDVAAEYGVSVYSVDTRSWKSKIVGTSKPDKDGNAKMPTIKHVVSLGFYSSIASTNKNGKIKYNDDAADSACIALYGFLPKKQRNLKKEE